MMPSPASPTVPGSPTGPVPVLSAWWDRRRRGVERRWCRWTGRPRWHAVGGVRLELPPDHALPDLQAAHPAYDRFLMHLAAQLQPGDAVVDVGANVGDTVAALLAGQPALQVLAVEADAGFAALFRRNAQRLAEAYPSSSVHLREALVAADERPRRLIRGEGTARAVPAAVDGIRPERLDALVASIGPGFSASLRLIKSDVDGNDADVLESASPGLMATGPMLYIECDPDRAVDPGLARARFASAMHPWREGGLDRLVVFENTGQLRAQAAGRQARDLLELELAALASPAGSAGRAHAYVDLLLHGPRHDTIVQLALQSFERSLRAHRR